MSLKQFNGRYSPHDDRIIFRFNTMDQSEYIFWLTRRITHYVLISTAAFIQKEYEKQVPSVEKVISEIQKPDKQGANFSKPFEPGVQYPIGGDAILVMDAKCKMIQIDDQEFCSLDFILPAGANMNLKLTMPVMKAMIMLLEELNVQAKWGHPK